MAITPVNPAQQTEVDDHLNRLLLEDTNTPWFYTIVGSIKELVNPTKLPPLELTSKPVAVKDIWGTNEGQRKTKIVSVVMHRRSSGSFAQHQRNHSEKSEGHGPPDCP
jgi:hypothetical protein